MSQKRRKSGVSLDENPLLGETIGANLRRSVERYGDRDALVVRHQGFRATYQELWDLVDRCARGLLATDIGKGDRVGIWSPNRYEWVVVQYATARIGAILVNINPAYRSHELSYVLQQAGVRTLVSAESFKTSDYVSMVAEVHPELPGLTEVIFLGSPEWEALRERARSVSVDRLRERSAAHNRRRRCRRCVRET